MGRTSAKTKKKKKYQKKRSWGKRKEASARDEACYCTLVRPFGLTITEWMRSFYSVTASSVCNGTEDEDEDVSEECLDATPNIPTEGTGGCSIFALSTLTGMSREQSKAALVLKKREMPQHLAAGPADYFSTDHLRAVLEDCGISLGSHNLCNDADCNDADLNALLRGEGTFVMLVGVNFSFSPLYRKQLSNVGRAGPAYPRDASVATRVGPQHYEFTPLRVVLNRGVWTPENVWVSSAAKIQKLCSERSINAKSKKQALQALYDHGGAAAAWWTHQFWGFDSSTESLAARVYHVVVVKDGDVVDMNFVNMNDEHFTVPIDDATLPLVRSGGIWRLRSPATTPYAYVSHIWRADAAFNDNTFANWPAIVFSTARAARTKVETKIFDGWSEEDVQRAMTSQLWRVYRRC